MVAISSMQEQERNRFIVAPLNRSPRRVTITVPHALYCRLLARSDHEGRSLSNLAAFLLEAALTEK
jgi:hypothetical protein